MDQLEVRFFSSLPFFHLKRKTDEGIDWWGIFKISDVTKAMPEINKTVDVMVTKGKWTIPGYKEKVRFPFFLISLLPSFFLTGLTYDGSLEISTCFKSVEEESSGDGCWAG